VLWRDFLAARTRRTDLLWNVFALAAWADEWKPERAEPEGSRGPAHIRA
jgi:hypothetical protein